MRKKEILLGRHIELYAATQDGEELSLFENDLNELDKKDADGITLDIKYMADNIQILWNKTKFNWLDYGLYEFKIKHFRVFTYNESNNLELGKTNKKKMVLLYVFKKKTQKTPTQEIRKCKKIIKELED